MQLTNILCALMAIFAASSSAAPTPVAEPHANTIAPALAVREAEPAAAVQFGKFGQQNKRDVQFGRFGQQNKRDVQFGRFGQQNKRDVQFGRFGQQNKRDVQFGRFGQQN